ncbi:MAG: diguanylate cyclase, partial [Firmicutes bacterium]|nr:diguanylate cyclase [Bacillota bacterium]
LDENGDIQMVVEQFYDVTERRRVEEELREAKALLEGVLDAIPDAVGIQDPEHHIIRLNKAGYQLLNLTPEQVKGKKCYELIGRTSRCRPCATERAWRTKRLERVEKYVPELGLYLDCRSNPILDENGDIQMVVEQFYDVTERRRVEEQLRYLTLHDSLTGLYNRAYFEEEMRRLGSGRHTPIGIIVCDVDGLKLVNDTLGHDAGDRLLAAAANVIRGSFRPDDMVARIGGDEFAILLPKSDRNAVEGACQRIRDAISRYNDEQPDIPLSISVGFAFSEDARLNIVELFKEADNNMYREKLHRSQSARSVVVQTLMHMLEERDFVTEGHVDRLQNLVVRLAGAVGLPEYKINDLRLLALFHDIGKVGVSDRILLKPGPLTPEERAEMQRHCEVGHRIAQSIPDLPPIANWILKHHEWWNGKGYPLGLKGEEIPLECRILAIADAYDAMTHDRPYRKAVTREEALAELKRCAGTQFDSDLVEKFVRIIEEESERA